MVNYRMKQVNEDIKRIIGEVINNEINDPRIPALCSVIRVDATKDLKFAKVYISVLGDADKSIGAVKVLNKASGFIRHKLSQTMTARRVPELRFINDTSIQNSIIIAKRINEIHESK